jgi:hypothetical protein
VNPVLDPMQPEALLYLPSEHGQPRLIGVEYIVINVGQPRPNFDGRSWTSVVSRTSRRRGVAHWSLHVWVNGDNPSGTFAPFNPTLSCPASGH